MQTKYVKMEINAEDIKPIPPCKWMLVCGMCHNRDSPVYGRKCDMIPVQMLCKQYEVKDFDKE